MVHTLREFLDFYTESKNLYIKCGENKIDVNLDREGSYFIVSSFLHIKFRFIAYEGKNHTLILDFDLEN
jgi:hypothetical protein